MTNGPANPPVFRRTSFAHTAHGKNRFSVPRELRAAVAEITGEDPSEIWVTLAPYGAIACLPRRWAEEDLAAATQGWIANGDDQLVAFALHVFARADVVTPDPSGRVSLPARLCEWAGVGRNGREVTWVGRGSWFELWSTPRLDAHLETLTDCAPVGLDWPDDVLRKLSRAFVQAMAGLGG